MSKKKRKKNKQKQAVQNKQAQQELQKQSKKFSFFKTLIPNKKSDGSKSKKKSVEQESEKKTEVKKNDKGKEKVKLPRKERTQHLLTSFKESVLFIIQFLLVPLIILTLATRLFAIRVAEREALYSSNAVIHRESITVRADGYGSVNSIKVGIGDYVTKGDILFTYTNSELDEKIFELEQKSVDILLEETDDSTISLNDFNRSLEFNVRARRNGIIKDIFITEGSFITRSDSAIEMEVDEVSILAELKVSPHLLNKLGRGLYAKVELGPQQAVTGLVKEVYPTYNTFENSVKAIIEIPQSQLNASTKDEIFTGSPAKVTVFTSDAFTQKYREYIRSLNQPTLSTWLNYEIK